MLKIDEDLAEEIGIHIGDGMMNHYPKLRMYYIKYVGHLEEKEVYGNHIIKLVKKLYKPKHIGLGINQKGTNCYRITIVSKEMFDAKKKLGLVPGPKYKIYVPVKILKSRRFFCSFMRGLFDTDGTLYFEKKRRDINYYPKIKIEMESKNVILHCANKLKKLKFNVSTSFNCIQRKEGKEFTTHRLVISGSNGLEKWMQLIGSNNLKHTTKYDVWKRFGYCPSYTTIVQRQRLMKRLRGR